MKLFICLAFFLGFTSVFGQNPDLGQSVSDLKQKIEKASLNGDRLKWMDSLCDLIEDKTEYQYEAIARQTIDYALELDSTRVALDNGISLLSYLRSDLGKPEQAIIFFNDLRDKVPLNKDFLELTYFYDGAADSYERHGDFDRAILNYEKACTFAGKMNDSIRMGTLKSYIGELLCFKGDFQKAAATLQESIEMLKVGPSRKIFRAKGTLAILYSQNGFQKEAKKIRLDILREARINQDYKALYGEFYNQAFDEWLHGSQKERLRYLDSARLYVYDDFRRQELLVAQLSAYSENGLVEKMKATKHMLDEHIKTHPSIEMDEYELAMGQYEYAMGNFKKAALWGEKEYDKAIAMPYYENTFSVHKFLSKVYSRLGDYKKSLTHFKAYSKIRDSIESVQKANGFSYYQSLYEVEKKDMEIAAQKSKISLLDKQNTIKRQWILFGGIGVFVLLLILYYRHKQKALENKILMAEITYKKKDLKDLALDITHNRQWALVLAEKLKDVKSSTGKRRAIELDKLETEIKNKIRVDETTEDFHNKVELLSSSFYGRLKEAYPDLTKSEIRLCSLIRMNMNTKQIATLQNINPSSVKTSRNRLRKKLNLMPGDDLNAFIASY
ncbi:hypothetical protein [Seonamhaeicola sp.]|uniref:hypothetical protein n=1 Tax=Seonamhaeicola sp. TaxID=1912245 RepID=UPI0026073191|nr:hypothetical protein [Seonamhaeicola sp.]